MDKGEGSGTDAENTGTGDEVGCVVCRRKKEDIRRWTEYTGGRVCEECRENIVDLTTTVSPNVTPVKALIFYAAMRTHGDLLDSISSGNLSESS